MGDEGFQDPPWEAPLDVDAVLASIPSSAVIRGMFPGAVSALARHRGLAPKVARSRYIPFKLYPLREHVALLAEVARAAWPDQPIRQGLRKIGRGAAEVMANSTLGGVTIGAAAEISEVIAGLAKTFEVLSRPGRIEVIERGPRRVVLALREIPFFIDSHHVGVYEGALRYASALDGEVRVRLRSPSEADFLCTWSGRR